MKLKEICLCIVVCILPVVHACGQGKGKPQRGVAIESWQTSDRPFTIRVTAYDESNAYLPGTYYVFFSQKAGSTAWYEIMTFRHDDRPKLPTDQIHFINKEVAFLFMGWKYAVTTDAGQTWFVWNAENDLAMWQCCNYGLIQDVSIANDGSGVMHLNPIHGRQGEVPQLRTEDYGRHWRAE